MSASAKRPFTKRFKRAKVAGGRGRGPRSGPGTFGALFSRLRRLEVLYLHLVGERNLTPGEVDKLTQAILFLEQVVEPKPSGGSEDLGEEVLLPPEGATDG